MAKKSILNMAQSKVLISCYKIDVTNTYVLFFRNVLQFTAEICDFPATADWIRSTDFQLERGRLYLQPIFGTTTITTE